MDFDKAAAYLLHQKGEDPDYDATTLFTTAKRLNGKLSKLPDDVKQVIQGEHKDQEDDDEVGYKVPLLYEGVEPETQERGSFTLGALKAIISNVKTIANSAVRRIKTQRNKMIGERLNRRSPHADKDLFDFIKQRSSNATAAIYDPDKKAYIFNVNEQLQLMIDHWETVFGQHRDKPPVWKEFTVALPKRIKERNH